jgi:hypothetical protein
VDQPDPDDPGRVPGAEALAPGLAGLARLPLPAQRADAIVIVAGILASFPIIPLVVIVCGFAFLGMWYADEATRRKARQ